MCKIVGQLSSINEHHKRPKKEDRVKKSNIAKYGTKDERKMIWLSKLIVDYTREYPIIQEDKKIKILRKVNDDVSFVPGRYFISNSKNVARVFELHIRKCKPT